MTAGEITTRGERGVLRFSLGSVVAVGLAVIAAAGVGIWVASLGPKLPSPSSFVDRLTTRDGAGNNGGYSFAHPTGWEMQTDGAVSKVSSPDRRMVVSVGPGPDGTLRQTSDAFVASMKSQYHSVEVSGAGSMAVDGSPALLTAGTAVTDRGSELRLYAIAMDEAGRHYLVAGFSDAGAADPTALSDRVREIADSLEAAD